MPESVTSIVVHLRSTLCQTVRYFREDFFEGPTLCRCETKASSFSAVILIPLLLLRPSIEPEHTGPVPHQLSLAFSGWPQKMKEQLTIVKNAPHWTNLPVLGIRDQAPLSFQIVHQ